MAEHDDQVIQPILAPQRLGARRMRQADLLVVGAVGGIVAPAIVRPNRS